MFALQLWLIDFSLRNGVLYLILLLMFMTVYVIKNLSENLAW